MENWTLSQRIDLAHELTTRNVAYAIASVTDKLAHTWTVTFVNNGVPADLNGATVVAYAIRSQDNVSVVLQGSLSGNVATVTLYPAVYAYEGTVSLLMRITKATTTISTVYAQIIVRQSYTGEVVDPGMVIPNLDQLIAMGAWVIEQINACDIATKFAEAMGQYAKEQGDYAKAQGDYAKSMGDYAKESGEAALQAAQDAHDAAEYAREQGDAAYQYAKDQTDGLMEEIREQVDDMAEEFGAMRDIAYDENAVLNLQRQIWNLNIPRRVMLYQAAWVEDAEWRYIQTIDVGGVTADETKSMIAGGLDPTAGRWNMEYWQEASVKPVAQGDDTVTFAADYIPAGDLVGVVFLWMSGIQTQR